MTGKDFAMPGNMQSCDAGAHCGSEALWSAPRQGVGVICKDMRIT